MTAFVLLSAFVAAPASQGQDTRTNYILNCMGCHLEDGSGAPGKVPSMRGSLVPLVSLSEGRRYLVRVPGVAQSPRSNREIAELLNWMIRNLSDLPVPATFVEFSEAEVAASRHELLTSVAATRARLLTMATATQPKSVQPIHLLQLGRPR